MILYEIKQENARKDFSEKNKNSIILKKKSTYHYNIKNKSISYPIIKKGRWSEIEHKEFINGLLKLGKNNWKKVKFLKLTKIVA